MFKKIKENDRSLVSEAISSFEKGDVERMTYAIERIFDEGYEKGIEFSRLEVAKDMLADNEPLEKIAKWTKLPLTKIEKLKNNL